MFFNYVLLLITGAISIYGLYDYFYGMQREKFLVTIATVVVFVLVLIATIKNIPYNDFKIMIEQSF